MWVMLSSDLSFDRQDCLHCQCIKLIIARSALAFLVLTCCRIGSHIYSCIHSQCHASTTATLSWQAGQLVATNKLQLNICRSLLSHQKDHTHMTKGHRGSCWSRCTGLMYLCELHTSSASWCSAPCMAKLPSTWSLVDFCNANWSLALHHDNISSPHPTTLDCTMLQT